QRGGALARLFLGEFGAELVLPQRLGHPLLHATGIEDRSAAVRLHADHLEILDAAREQQGRRNKTDHAHVSPPPCLRRSLTAAGGNRFDYFTPSVRKCCTFCRASRTRSS